MDKQVKVDIGGTQFKTYVSTLKNIPYFQSVFNLEKDIKDNYFIDRDPKIFRHILNLVRDPKYHFPEKYLSELEFWGFQYETENKKLDISHNKNNKFVELSNLTKSPFFIYLFGHPTHTVFKNIYQRLTPYLFQPTTLYYDSCNWEIEPDYDAIGSIYLMLKNLSDVKLELMLRCKGDKEWHSNSYDLEVTPFVSKVENLYGYYHVPITFFTECTTRIAKPLRLRIKLSSEKTDIPSALRFYHSDMDEEEKRKFHFSSHEFLHKKFISFEFENQEMMDISFYTIYYVIWKTSDEFDYVELIGDTNRTIDRIEFEYEGRSIHGLSKLENGWGSIYFNNPPDNFSSVFYSDNCKIKFPKKTSGKVWLYVLEFGRLVNYKNFTSEFICGGKPNIKILEYIRPPFPQGRVYLSENDEEF